MRIGSKKLPKINFGDVLVWLSRTCITEVLLVVALILSRYQINMDFSYPAELIVPVLLFSVIAAVVYYAYRYLFGRVTTAHLAALPLLYCLFSFNQILGSGERFAKALIPGRFETSFVIVVVFALLLAIIFGVVAYILTKLSDHHSVKSFQIPKVVLFLVVFVFSVQLLQTGSKLISILPELNYHYKAPDLAQDTSKITSKPNIYYLVFDRYGNAEQLQKQYGFDNGRLLDYLDQQGFVTNSAANANYPFTMSSIGSTLAMGYHTQLKQFEDDSLQTGFPYRDVLNNPPVAQALEQNGYTYNQVSSWWDFTRVGIKADNNPTQAFKLDVFGARYALSDLQRDIFDKSIIGGLLRKGITVGDTAVIKYSQTINPRQNFENQVAALKSVASQKHTTPQFTFAHVLVPHDPYIFMPDGTQPTYDGSRNDSGIDEKTKYTNQLAYLNTRMQDLVGSLRASDPNAAIVIQADEGPYPKEFRYEQTPDHHYNPKDLSDELLQQKFGVLASYYMPGVDKSTVANNITTSVNPFRFVLSHYLGYDLPPLPTCNYANGSKFNVFKYDLITERLTGASADPACSKL